MEKITDPKAFPSDDLKIPGLKPPVFDFAPVDDGDPREVDEFNRWIRDLRNQHPAVCGLPPRRTASAPRTR